MAPVKNLLKSLNASKTVTRGRLPGEIGVRSGALDDSEEDLANLERVISKWNATTTSTMLFQSSPDEACHYLAAVDSLQQLMENLSVEDSSSVNMIRAQRLMESSMAYLEKEFHRILLSNRDALYPDWAETPADSRSSSSSSADDVEHGIRKFDVVPMETVLALKTIARRMALAGYGMECVRVFALARRSVIEESLHNLGLEKFGFSEVQKMEWKLLDAKIRRWIDAAKISIRVLFAGEKRLCDQVFEGFDHVRDSAFVEVAKEATTRLLRFAEAVAPTRRSPEKLFRILDMYETLGDLSPDIERLYCQEPFRALKAQVPGILGRLGDAGRENLKEFTTAIQRENSKTPTAGGTVHPLTKYVMNYLSLLSDYKETLIKISAGTSVDLPKGLPEGLAPLLAYVDDPLASLCVRLEWIVVALQCKLDTKSELYKDVALSYLFLTNNLHYIVQKVEGSELRFLLGQGFVTKNLAMVRQYAANYENAAWTKVLSCLMDEGIPVGGGFPGRVLLETIKDRFIGFNVAMEEVIECNAGWEVPDVRLRNELVVSIADKLIPAYRSFLGRYGSWFEIFGHSDMYIKYMPEDLEIILLDIFNGKSLSISSMKSP